MKSSTRRDVIVLVLVVLGTVAARWLLGRQVYSPQADRWNRVANMSLEELAENLGGPMGEWWRVDLMGPGGDITIWRLIEEGRKAPDRVCDILEKSIAGKIEHLQEIREKQKVKLPGSSDYTYVSSADAKPTQCAIAGAFYVLANIGRLNDPVLLDRWIAAPQPVGYEPLQIQGWFIDFYFRLTDAAGSPHAAAHLAIVDDWGLRAGDKEVQELRKWDKLWGVWGVYDLERIEVLSISGPPRGPRHGFRSVNFTRVQENFHEYVKQLEKGN